jgi:predicted MFS family arabinose efflux permease
LAATTAGAVIALGMPLADSNWTALCFSLGQAGFAAGITAFSIVTRTHRQSVTPPDLLPRVVASVRFFTWGAIPVGALLGGAAADTLGARNALFAGCAAAFLAPLALYFSQVRHSRDLAD